MKDTGIFFTKNTILLRYNNKPCVSGQSQFCTFNNAIFLYLHKVSILEYAYRENGIDGRQDALRVFKQPRAALLQSATSLQECAWAHSDCRFAARRG